MKILLVRCIENLKFSPPYLRETNITGVYPPLGLAYIASVIKRAGYNVEVLDAHALNLSLPSFKKYIKTNPADMVFFTSTTLSWPNVLEAAKIVKEIFPKSLVGVGGPQLSIYPEESVSFDWVDIGIVGEGEITVLEIIKKYTNRIPITDIKGTVIKQGGNIVVNPHQEFIQNLDEIPFPAIELLPHKKYHALSAGYPFFTMVTSRGCPYKCRFCSQVYLGDKFRQRSAENVVEEMELYVKKYKVKELILFDETFTMDKDRVVDICNLINERNLKFRWDIRTRVDTIDKEMLGYLKSAGCYSLHMGAESGSQEILDAMNKGITLSQIKEAFRSVAELGFKTRAYFMLGYPGENLDTIRKTIVFSKALNPHWASFSITIPHPATEIYKWAIEKGFLKNDYWRDFTLGKAEKDRLFFPTEEYDENRLRRLKNFAYLSFYLRPAWLVNFLFLSFRSLFKDVYNNLSVFSRLFFSW